MITPDRVQAGARHRSRSGTAFGGGPSKLNRVKTRSIVVISIIGFVVASAGVAVAGGKFRANIVKRGATWWCDSWGNCHRDQWDCTENGDTCGEVVDAYVFTSGDSVLVDVHSFDTKELCTERQRQTARYDEDVSACVRVGPTKIPAPKLPRGRGWYCMAYQAATMNIVECLRSKRSCEKQVDAVFRMEGILATKVSSRCAFHAKVWASASVSLTEEAGVMPTRDQCESSRRLDMGYPCVEVK